MRQNDIATKPLHDAQIGGFFTSAESAMFLQTPKDMYDKYHHATNDGAREYWYKCLQVRLQTGVEHEKVRYYLNRIDKAVLAKHGAGAEQ